MNLPNPMVNQTVDPSGQVQSWATYEHALDERFGATGSVPVFRVSTGTLVPTRNVLGGHYAPGLGTGSTISGDRLFLPSDLGKVVVVASQANKATHTPMSLLDDLLGSVLNRKDSGNIVNGSV